MSQMLYLGSRALRRLGAGLLAALLAGVVLAAADPPAAPAGAAPPAVSPAQQQKIEQALKQGTKALAPPAPGANAATPVVPAAEREKIEQATQRGAKALAPGAPATAEAATDTRGLDQEIQGLKKDVVDLNRDLFVLEEELLFPANTQVAVFLSVDIGDFFALDSVQLKIDQKEVINYLYTPREVDALLKGGVQRLYVGNLKVGPHELVAFFNGKGTSDRAYKRGASLRFEKGVGAKYLELKIADRQRKLQPEFEIHDWE